MIAEVFDFLYMAVMSVLTLGVLVFVHELGHFLVAKWCGVCVLDFSIGFGKALYRFRSGETTYFIRAIPLGGYVKMLGDDPFEKFSNDSASDKDSAESLATEGAPDGTTSTGSRGERAFAGTERLEPPEPIDPSRHFLNQTLPEKFAIVLAGPAFNMIFAVIVAIAAAWIYGISSPIGEPVIGHVTPKLPAAEAGIQVGDRVTHVDGTPVESWIQLADTVRNSGGKSLRFSILRPATDGASDGVAGQVARTGAEVEADVSGSDRPGDAPSGYQAVEIVVAGTDKNTELNVLDGTYDRDPNARPHRIGIGQAMETSPVTFGAAIPIGFQHVWAIIELTGKMFAAMFDGVISPSQTLGGPVAVFAGAAQSAAQGAESVLNFLVLLSVSLALFNLLPVPILDGGHLLFFAIEAVRGKPLSVKWLAVANQVGLFLLLSLMLFAVSNDVFRLVSN
jgi:regulator of sigma E protease